jgi:capsular polysaccharide biosynthesis protein
VLIPIVAFQGRATTYVASMRVFMSGSVTDSSKATALADTVAAIATSRTQVASALNIADVSNDPGAFAKNISVQPVGNSGILDLSVRAQDPVAAANVANALTAGVVQVMREVNLSASRPFVIDSASAATAKPISSTRNQDLAFGAMLGLVVGIVAAALAEALSPTVVGREAIAAELGAPVLGMLPNLRRAPAPRELSWLRWQLGVQASRIGVSTAELTAVGRRVDLAPLSTALEVAGRLPRPAAGARRRRRPVPALRGAEALAPEHAESPGVPERPSLAIRVLDQVNPLTSEVNGSAGVVVVTPTALKRAEIDPLNDLLAITGWPVLGVIAYRRGSVLGSLRGLADRAKATRPWHRARTYLPWLQQP